MQVPPFQDQLLSLSPTKALWSFRTWTQSPCVSRSSDNSCKIILTNAGVRLQSYYTCIAIQLASVYRLQVDSHPANTVNPVPWSDIVSDPSKFYDTEKFKFPAILKDPQTYNSLETLMLGQFLSSNETPVLFQFWPETPKSLDKTPSPTTPVSSPRPERTPTPEKDKTPTPPPPSQPKTTGRKTKQPRCHIFIPPPHFVLTDLIT